MKENMVCGNCDRQVPADAKLCPYCGAEFVEEQNENDMEFYIGILLGKMLCED